MPLLVVLLIGLGAFGLGLWLFKAMLDKQPDTVTLKRIEVSPRDDVEAALFAFEALGYTRVGTFGVQEKPDLRVHGLVHPTGRAGVVHESGERVFCDVVAWQKDGTDHTWTSLVLPEELPTPPWKTLHRLEGGPEALHAASLGVEDLDPVEDTTFAGRYMADYARSTAWLKENV